MDARSFRLHDKGPISTGVLWDYAALLTQCTGEATHRHPWNLDQAGEFLLSLNGRAAKCVEARSDLAEHTGFALALPVADCPVDLGTAARDGGGYALPAICVANDARRKGFGKLMTSLLLHRIFAAHEGRVVACVRPEAAAGRLLLDAFDFRHIDSQDLAIGGEADVHEIYELAAHDYEARLSEFKVEGRTPEDDFEAFTVPAFSAQDAALRLWADGKLHLDAEPRLIETAS